MSNQIADNLRRLICDSDWNDEGMTYSITDSEYQRITETLSKVNMSRSREEINEALNSEGLASSSKSIHNLQKFLKYYLAFRKLEDNFFKSTSSSHLDTQQFRAGIKAGLQAADDHINQLDLSSWYQ